MADCVILGKSPPFCASVFTSVKWITIILYRVVLQINSNICNKGHFVNDSDYSTGVPRSIALRGCCLFYKLKARPSPHQQKY